MKNTCETCTHSTLIETHRVCRRYPPQSTLVPAQGLAGPTVQLVSYWPQVQNVDVCGEHDSAPSVSFVGIN